MNRSIVRSENYILLKRKRESQDNLGHSILRTHIMEAWSAIISIFNSTKEVK